MSTTFLIVGSILILYGLLFLLILINSTRINRGYYKASTCVGEKRFKDALAHLKRILAIWPAPDLINSSWKKQRSVLLSYRAHCYIQLEEYEKAQTDCNKALALDPKSTAAYTYRGETFYSLDQLDKALMDMNTAVNLMMDNPIPPMGSTVGENIWKIWPVVNRAMVHNKMGHPELALKDYELAKHLVPGLKIVGNDRPISDYCELCAQ